MPANELQGETMRYPDAEIAAWTNEWLSNPEAQKKTMLMFFIEKACDWQRSQDALLIDLMYEMTPDDTEETFFSGLAQASAAIRGGSNG